MSDVLVRAGIVDCDIHPAMRSKSELDPWLPERWRKHLAEYGHQVRIPFTSGTQYPKSAPATARRDAWPPAGGQASRRAVAGADFGYCVPDVNGIRT